MTLANDFRYSTAMSSSSTVEDRYHRLPNSFWVSSGQELMNNNPVPFQVVSGAHLFSSSSGFCNDSLHGRNSQTHPPPINTMPSDRFAMQDQPQEFTVPLEDFFDFDDHVPVPNLQAQSTGPRVVSSEELYRKSEWQNWADELISVDDGSQPNWSQLLGDSSDHNPNPKMPEPFSDVPRLAIKAIEQHQMVSSEEQLSGRNVTSKQRMRWTQELHEAFVDAVNHLGGSEQAKPKAVVKLLNVPGLTIYHVKSHLQKYRTARYKPETSIEVTGEAQEKKMTSVEDVKTLDMKTSFEITQALRLQMEVQKRLHEQLEIQRSLQLQIEKQGRYLQMMFEKQQKLQQENKSSSPSEPSPSNTSAHFGLETESASASRKRVRED